MNHVSRITFHASRFTHHVSRVTFHASRFTHHVSRITFHASFVIPSQSRRPPSGASLRSFRNRDRCDKRARKSSCLARPAHRAQTKLKLADPAPELSPPA